MSYSFIPDLPFKEPVIVFTILPVSYTHLDVYKRQFIKYPISLYDTLILFMPVFMLLPLYWGINRYPVFYFEETPKSINISYRLVLITLGAITMYRAVLGIGINIG